MSREDAGMPGADSRGRTSREGLLAFAERCRDLACRFEAAAARVRPQRVAPHRPRPRAPRVRALHCTWLVLLSIAVWLQQAR
jgi:hypothetical protein